MATQITKLLNSAWNLVNPSDQPKNEVTNKISVYNTSGYASTHVKVDTVQDGRYSTIFKRNLPNNTVDLHSDLFTEKSGYKLSVIVTLDNNFSQRLIACMKGSSEPINEDVETTIYIDETSARVIYGKQSFDIALKA